MVDETGSICERKDEGKISGRLLTVEDPGFALKFQSSTVEEDKWGRQA